MLFVHPIIVPVVVLQMIFISFLLMETLFVHRNDCPKVTSNNFLNHKPYPSDTLEGTFFSKLSMLFQKTRKPVKLTKNYIVKNKNLNKSCSLVIHSIFIVIITTKRL